MIVSESNSDIFAEFESRDNAILIHCCNCFNTMGAGIAKLIAARYPEAFEADETTARGDIGKLGSWTSADVGGRIVVNLYGQYRYGTEKRHLDYDALRKGLASVVAFYGDVPYITYRLGCNLAGGEWPKVRAIIEEVSGDKHKFTIRDKSL